MKYAVYWRGTLYARFVHHEHAKIYVNAIIARFLYVNPTDLEIKEEEA